MDAQSALRRCIELFSHNTRFFIVAENMDNLMLPILSRLTQIYVPEPILNSKSINLYKYNLNAVFDMKDEKVTSENWLKKELQKQNKKTHNPSAIRDKLRKKLADKKMNEDPLKQNQVNTSEILNTEAYLKYHWAL